MERKWLVNRRKEQGFTQMKLAQMVGISNRHLSLIEKGERNPSGPVAMRLSKALGFDMAYFFTNNVRLDGKEEKKFV